MLYWNGIINDLAKILTWVLYMFSILYDEVTNVLCVSLLSHDRYQYDSLILSKQTWAYPRQHLHQLLWYIVSVHLNLLEVEEQKLCLWYWFSHLLHFL
jgi:hypothetical protein